MELSSGKASLCSIRLQNEMYIHIGASISLICFTHVDLVDASISPTRFTLVDRSGEGFWDMYMTCTPIKTELAYNGLLHFLPLDWSLKAVLYRYIRGTGKH